MDEILQLKITLQNSKPPIWRRILVSSNTTFFKLHHILQTTMGWETCHLYEFNVHNYRIGELNDEFEDFGYGENDLADASSVALKKVITKVKDTFNYEYDFGDGWSHKIIVEKILPRDNKIKYPICIAGKLNCPPEDCGGVWGYYNLLDTIKDKKNPEHQMMLEWFGEGFDEKFFDKDEVNKIIQNY